MTVIYLTEHNTKCYWVTFQNNGWIVVEYFKDISCENNIYCVKHSETFLGKSEVCGMTLMSKASNKSVFDGTTFLLKITEENDKHRCLYVGGDIMCSFLTNNII